MTTLTQPTTQTLKVSGATLAYDVRRNDKSKEPPLFLIGSPMGAAGFSTLAGHFPGRTIVTYDPRGVERSVKDDVKTPVDPDMHGDDISHVIDAIGGGPVDMFASSGGAVNALALVARHPGKVRTLVAHEPPLAGLLPERQAALDACRAVAETYQQKGFGHGMAQFIALVSLEGPIPPDFAGRPYPAPGDMGMPNEDDGFRDDPLLGQNMVTCTQYEPDFGVLRSVPTRIVIAAGETSGDTLACRTAHALADKIGVETTILPGDHAAFLGGEYGQTGDPHAFGPALRRVLAG
jgi:pimeloyl-ACP methyl ester carboxylesterase